jgi:tRNA dimethylallyltransferase
VLRAVEIHRLTGATPSSRAQTAEHRALRRYQPERPFLGIGVDPGDTMAERVKARFDAMLDAGLLDEVATLAPRLGRTARHAVGYAQLLPVVAGDVPLAVGRDAAIRATMALAKRQRTFFRRDPRIRWIIWHDDGAERLAGALDILEREPVWIS